MKIKSIKKTNNTHRVYDLSVEGNNNFFIGSNGNILTHNCDYFLPLPQGSLRQLIEDYGENVRFILTCNKIERVIEPIKSRCEPIKIEPSSKPDIAKHLDNILGKENIEYKKEDLALIVNRFYPDMRKMLNNIQLFSPSGKLKIDNNVINDNKYIDQIIKILKNQKHDKYKSVLEIRQALANSNIGGDYTELFIKLYERIEEFMEGPNISLGIIAIEDYLYKSNLVIDKEINIMACISKLINIKNK